MSLVTEVILGNADRECAKLGNAAILDVCAVEEDMLDEEEE